MMYPKRRKIPISVSVWMDKDVHIRKATASSGLMPDTTRYNVFLSRKFYSDMLDLSSERYRKIARFEHGKRSFLKKQQRKAETLMPGLLPYIEPHIIDKDHDSLLRFPSNRDDQLKSLSKLISNRDEQIKSPSSQSFTTRSFIKSESTYFQGKSSVRKEISLEKINNLSQPKRRYYNSIIKDHRKPNVIGSLTVQNLFGNIDNTYYQNSFESNQSNTSTDDKRFRRLIHLFTEVHERNPSNIHQSVESLMQSNESLKFERKNTHEEEVEQEEEKEEHEEDILDHSCFNKTDMDLINACV